ncbi:glycosyltransferase [candidate division GN15 bacterium]|nr:glycosyltransferase [candidate division GN15 bacterium]
MTTIIPALNEELSLPEVLAELPAFIDTVIVCDNGSTDRTAEVAREGGAEVVREEEKGYGAACLKAVAAAPQDTNILLFIDADYSDYPAEAESIVRPIIDDRGDLVIGSRMLTYRDHRAIPPVAAFGNWLTTNLIRLIWRQRFTDMGPFRAIRFEAYRSLNMQDRNFGWTTEMQVKAVKRGLRCVEVPVSYRARIGTSKISGTISGSIRAGVKFLWIITREALRR